MSVYSDKLALIHRQQTMNELDLVGEVPIKSTPEHDPLVRVGLLAGFYIAEPYARMMVEYRMPDQIIQAAANSWLGWHRYMMSLGEPENAQIAAIKRGFLGALDQIYEQTDIERKIGFKENAEWTYESRISPLIQLAYKEKTDNKEYGRGDIAHAFWQVYHSVWFNYGNFNLLQMALRTQDKATVRSYAVQTLLKHAVPDFTNFIKTESVMSGVASVIASRQIYICLTTLDYLPQ
jgi:hypothetical protein